MKKMLVTCLLLLAAVLASCGGSGGVESSLEPRPASEDSSRGSGLPGRVGRILERGEVYRCHLGLHRSAIGTGIELDAIRAEVQTVCADPAITAEHVARLTITERVIKEALRLYPPAPIMSRTPLETTNAGGIELHPGDHIIIPIFAIHRHASLWDDPDRFDPDRFLPDREAALKRTQFMPFGAGPRICLGAAFAMVEAKVLLASFVRAARFDWDGRHLPEPLSRVTLHPEGGMPLAVTML